MLNVISIDVEEYFHAANLAAVVDSSKWSSMPSRVNYSTHKVMELLARTNTTATFFILGSVAQKSPQLVREIAQAGHEVASHGFGHQLSYEQTPAQFFNDVHYTKQMLEDLSGKPVRGYRAPNFSIKDGNAWAYDKLIEAGYRYDSSRYPIWHPRYANQDKSTKPEIVSREKGKLYIFPLAVDVVRVLGRELRLPVAGGAYWRLFPKACVLWGLRGIQTKEPGWFTCYFHPWELDPDQPFFNNLSFLTKLRHYGCIKTFERKAEQILLSFKFGPCCEAGKQCFGEKFLELDHTTQ
jgi:polysaccharide deacetylase family protein (PEP-CTERM system associated)